MAKNWAYSTQQQPVAGVDYDPDQPMCQDDYEWFTSTGRYEGNGWAEWKQRQSEQTPGDREMYWAAYWAERGC